LTVHSYILRPLVISWTQPLPPYPCLVDRPENQYKTKKKKNAL
jgi:hypothetical protein